MRETLQPVPFQIWTFHLMSIMPLPIQRDRNRPTHLRRPTTRRDRSSLQSGKLSPSSPAQSSLDCLLVRSVNQMRFEVVHRQVWASRVRLARAVDALDSREPHCLPTGRKPLSRLKSLLFSTFIHDRPAHMRFEPILRKFTLQRSQSIK